ncbi:MAG TPA: hypothetical protein VGE97_05600 [Nitrososphaera sp.]
MTTISESQREVPFKAVIGYDHVQNGEGDRFSNFRANEQYFEVKINEMFLSKSREWYKKYDPMVFAISEFNYGTELQIIPFIVGPNLIEKYGKKMDIPLGMIFSDTQVTGLYPYCGGPLSLTVILYGITRENYAQDFLRMVERMTGLFEFTNSLSIYTKIANVVMDGFETIIGLKDTKALIGMRREFSPDSGDAFQPCYFVLIDTPEDEIDINKLWVNRRQLMYGPTIEDAYPFRDADFVLYSISQSIERTDLTRLPFYSLWQRVRKEAMVPRLDAWESAKSNMLALYQEIMTSPDLTKSHASRLIDVYRTEMKQLNQEAIKTAELGGENEDPFGQIRSRSLDVLSL